MKRITRQRFLTDEEFARDEDVRMRVMEEFLPAKTTPGIIRNTFIIVICIIWVTLFLLIMGLALYSSYIHRNDPKPKDAKITIRPN